MNWSWKIISVYGISIRLHWTMLAFLAWIGIANLADHGAKAALISVTMVGMVFIFVVLHELGHALTAQAFGIRTRDITLLPIGGIARLQKIPEEPRQEMFIALAGPAVNFAIATVVGISLLLVSSTNTPSSSWTTTRSLLAFAFIVNMGMGLFNLLPAFPMDGGRVLRALLVRHFGYVKATSISAVVGQSLAIALGIAGLFSNGILIFIALFVYLGAEQENLMVQVHRLLRGVSTLEAMRRHFVTLKMSDGIQLAFNEFIAGNQHDFPVVDQENHFCGMVYHNDLLKALTLDPPLERVDQVMKIRFRSVSDDSTLESVFNSMNENECSVLPVVREKTVIGLISLENIGEWILIHSPVFTNVPLQDLKGPPLPNLVTEPHGGSQLSV